MNDSVQVNQVYLIFNRPQFLVDSSDNINIIKCLSQPKSIHGNGAWALLSPQKAISFQKACKAICLMLWPQFAQVLIIHYLRVNKL